MEIKVVKISEEKEERLLLECHEVTPQVNSIVRFAKSLQRTISGEADEREYEINIYDILYVESVDNKSFLYTNNKVYRIRERLYELEEILSEASFLRVSKAIVVNLMKIKSIKPALNGRFSAVLTNGEEVIISRKYVPNLKEKLRGKTR